MRSVSRAAPAAAAAEAEPPPSPAAAAEKGEERPAMHYWIWLGVNACVSVALVIVNKLVFQRVPQRSFIVFLTLVHQVCNFCYVQLMQALGLKDSHAGPQPSAQDAFLCAFGFASYITLSNSSLSTNSVAFYQTAKVMEIPLMFVGQLLVLRIRKSANVVLSLLLVVTGLLVAAYTDLHLSFQSVLFAGAASVADCFYTVMTARARRGGVSADALMRSMSPGAIGLLLVALASQVTFRGDGAETSWMHSPDLHTVGLLAASCALAVLLNLSFFVVLGHFEPVTLSMFREVKTILVVVAGFGLSRTLPPTLNILGILMALGGAFTYSQVNS